MNQQILASLDLRVRARYPLIALRTQEEARALRYIEALMSLRHHAHKPLFHWSRVSGLRQVAGPGLTEPREIPDRADPQALFGFLETYLESPGPDGPQVGVFVLADFGPYLAPMDMADPLMVRWLRELARKIEGQHLTLIFLGPPSRRSRSWRRRSLRSTCRCPMRAK